MITKLKSSSLTEEDFNNEVDIDRWYEFYNAPLNKKHIFSKEFFRTLIPPPSAANYNTTEDICGICMDGEPIKAIKDKTGAFVSAEKVNGVMIPKCGHGLHQKCFAELIHNMPDTSCIKCRDYNWIDARTRKEHAPKPPPPLSHLTLLIQNNKFEIFLIILLVGIKALDLVLNNQSRQIAPIYGV